jgi:hypothetical protein
LTQFYLLFCLKNDESCSDKNEATENFATSRTGSLVIDAFNAEKNDENTSDARGSIRDAAFNWSGDG